MKTLRLHIAMAVTLLAMFARGATYVVPEDRQMVRAADAIVIGDVFTSYAQLDAAGEIETVTEISVTGVLKGSVLQRHIRIHEPGGYLAGRAKFIADVPHFSDGDHVLLFLSMTPNGSWVTWNLELGRLTFTHDDAGREILMRTSAVIGWNSDGTSHAEEPRVAERFVNFVRDEAAGRTPVAEYLAPGPLAAKPKQPQATVRAPSLKPAPLTTYTATSYTADVGNGEGARWNSVPQVFYTEPNVTSDDVNAAASAITPWTTNASSTIAYSYAGPENCDPNATPSTCHTSGLSAPDNLNTILWERDLTQYGIPPFDCYQFNGGVVAIGGITLALGTHNGPNGEVFMTTLEADVEMNQGVNACVSGGYLSLNAINAAVAHEIGHTLGFRHADQLRIDDPFNNCDTNVLLECAATPNNPAPALMQTFLFQDIRSIGASLQPWDDHAAAAVYPPLAIPPTPTNVVATGTTGTNVHITWTASTGAASYQVLRRARGQTSYTALSNCCSAQTYCSGANCAFDDSSVTTNSAYVYEVAALNSGSAASQPSSPDLATTVMFTVDNPLCVGNGNPSDPQGCSGAPPTTVKARVVNDLVDAVNAMCLLDTNAACVASVAYQQPIAASTIRNLRAAVTSVRSHLTLPSITFTDDGPWGSSDTGHTPTFIRAVHIRELRTSVQ